MSLLWRDQVSIYLAPRRLALARHARGRRGRVVASQEVVVENGNISDAGPVLGRLAELLAEPAWQRADARVCVADHWVRYAVAPPLPAALDTAGRRSHARFLMADTYGEGIADWDVAIEESPPGHGAVVSALLAGLSAQLAQVLTGARLQLLSVQPHLTVAFNAWRSLLPQDNAWFITLREGWMAGAHLTGGHWDRVHTARLVSHAIVELERLQRASNFALPGGSGDRFFVEAPAWMRERLSRIATEFEWLDTSETNGGPAHEIELLTRVGT